MRPRTFSITGPEIIIGMIGFQGFEKIQFQRYDCDMRISYNTEDAVEFAMKIEPTGKVIGLAEDDGSIWTTPRARFVTAYQD